MCIRDSLVGVRHDHHAAGVLTGGALDAGAAQRQAVFLGVIDGALPLVQIFFNVAVGRFILNTGHRTGLEHVGLAEQFLCVAVHIRLVLAGEVQVDIRFLITVEAEEGLEGDVMPSTSIRVPQWWQFLSGRSKPSSTLPSVINSLCLHLGQR